MSQNFFEVLQDLEEEPILTQVKKAKPIKPFHISFYGRQLIEVNKNNSKQGNKKFWQN